MDPVTVLLGLWGQLGVIGSVVIGLGLIGWKLWGSLDKARADNDAARDAHMTDVKAFGEKYSEALLENSKANSALATAIDRIGDRIK